MKLRVCLEPGCGELTAKSRCEHHDQEHAHDVKSARDRNEPWRYLYGLTIWREAREAKRRQAGYVCERCGRSEEWLGRVALDVHHVRALRDLWRMAGGGTPTFDQARFEYAATDEDALRCLCDPCHAIEELEA